MNERLENTEPPAREPDAATPANPNGDGFAEEIVRSRANEKLMAFLDARAKEPATVPLDEVKERLGI